jgi:hypothetical protein
MKFLELLTQQLLMSLISKCFHCDQVILQFISSNQLVLVIKIESMFIFISTVFIKSKNIMMPKHLQYEQQTLQLTQKQSPDLLHKIILH